MSRRSRQARQYATPAQQLVPTAAEIAAEVIKTLTLPAGAIATDATRQAHAIANGSHGMGGRQAAPLVVGGWNDPLVAFGPGAPVRPAPIDPLGPNGRPAPRRSDYQVSFNLPGSGERLVPWSILRQLADGVGIIRKCVEIRKKQITQLAWDFVPAESAFELLMLSQAATRVELDRAKKAAAGDRNARVEQRQTETRAAWERQWRADNAEDIIRLKRWWQRPDSVNQMTWQDWTGVAMEEHLVLDALTVYPRLTFGGDLHSLIVLSGETIKPLLDHSGNTPQPPLPAYQQVLHGFPRGEFTASPGADGEYAADTLIYRPMLRRASTPYGFGPVERSIQDADLYMKRRAWMVSEYDDGVAPELLVNVDAAMTPQQLLDYERVFNDMLSGNTRERHRAKMLPKGFAPTLLPSLESRYKPDYDLFLIRMIGGAFDISAAELGFPPQGGLGGAGFDEGDQNRNERQALLPTAQWFASIVGDVSTQWLGMPDALEFRFVGLDDDADDQAAEDAAVKAGRKTLNESRDDQGLPRYDIPEADEPLLFTQMGVVPLRGIGDRANAKAQAALAPPPVPGQQGQQEPSGDGAGSGPAEKPSPDAKPDTKPGDAKVPAPRTEKTATCHTCKGSGSGTGRGIEQDGVACDDCGGFGYLYKADAPAPTGQGGRWTEGDLKAIARNAMKDANITHCPCGLPVTWDDTDGYQHADGSVSHDGKFHGRSVSNLIASQMLAGKSADTDDKPVEVIAAGLVVQAQSTGRVLMLQRALTDGDPASGRWEFPGGCRDGVESPEETARREWSEETGMHVPPGDIVASWQSGPYVGFVLSVPDEDAVDLRGDKVTYNPDDPDHDVTEALAWWAPPDLRDNPAIRDELAASLDVALTALQADDAAKSAEAAAFRTYLRRCRKGERRWRPFGFQAHPTYVGTAANDLAGAGEWAAAAAVLDVTA